MARNNEKLYRVNISIYPTDRAMLEQIGKDHGIASLSGTIRWIIYDWKHLKTQQNMLAERGVVYSTE